MSLLGPCIRQTPAPALARRSLRFQLLCPLGPLGSWVRLDAEAGEETSGGFQGALWIPPLTSARAIETIFTKTKCPAWTGLLQQLHPHQYMQDSTARQGPPTLGPGAGRASSLGQATPCPAAVALWVVFAVCIFIAGRVRKV